MTAVILSGSDPDVWLRTVDIDAQDGEVVLHDVVDEPDRPLVRTVLAYTPDDADALAELLMAAAMRARFVDTRQMELITQ